MVSAGTQWHDTAGKRAGHGVRWFLLSVALLAVVVALALLFGTQSTSLWRALVDASSLDRTYLPRRGAAAARAARRRRGSRPFRRGARVSKRCSVTRSRSPTSSASRAARRSAQRSPYSSALLGAPRSSAPRSCPSWRSSAASSPRRWSTGSSGAAPTAPDDHLVGRCGGERHRFGGHHVLEDPRERRQDARAALLAHGFLGRAEHAGARLRALLHEPRRRAPRDRRRGPPQPPCARRRAGLALGVDVVALERRTFFACSLSLAPSSA